jgi:hypothetical protein
MEYQIKNWDKFQHFKQRTPPWIKLYRDILDDPEWHALPGDAAKTLIMLWLIASDNKVDEQDGRLPELSRLAFRLRITENRLVSHLEALKHYVYHHDIIMISPCNQDATPETETETEKRQREIREQRERENARRRAIPPDIADVIEYCRERGTGIDPHRWFNFYSAKNWMIGKNKMKDWQAAVRTWEEKKASTEPKNYSLWTEDDIKATGKKI